MKFLKQLFSYLFGYQKQEVDLEKETVTVKRSHLDTFPVKSPRYRVK
jgi:hypothetical protein